MPEKFLYSLDKAKEEADKLKEKINSGEADNYSDAEKLVENEKNQQEQEIEIDPEFLEHIRSLKTEKEHNWELTKTRFAANAISDKMYEMIYDALSKINIEDLLKKLKENINKINYCDLEEYEDEDGDDLLLCDAFSYLFNKVPFSETERYAIEENLKFKGLPEINEDGTLELEEKRKERHKEFNEILEKYLKDQVVVDLGAGRGDFLWGATLYGAKEYIGIDNPNGNGKETEGERKTPIELDFFDIDFPKEFCKNKYISIDILEGLYTKIQDNSSCFVIFGVDESYGFKPEYVQLANKLIAEKTKVGGIVVCWGSIIGQKMPEENFELIESWGKGSWGAHVWLKKK